jgi:hypothetical protein
MGSSRHGLRGMAPVVVGVAIVILTACATEKSSNPLAPTVAGPIPGVSISSPVPVDPSAGSRVPVDHQPLTLTFGNAVTNGVRPLHYRVEVAADAGFKTQIFSKPDVQPGDGQTSLRLPDALGPERTYYWRARPEDGANSGDYSTAVSFDVYTPVVFGAPALLAPINDTAVTTLQPQFRIGNASRSGPAGAVSYEVQLTQSSFDAGFDWYYGEGAGETSFSAPVALTAGSHYTWRARAKDATTTGPWSASQGFSVQAGSNGGGAGGGGGGFTNAADGIPLGSAIVVGGSPGDIASWAVTTSINRIVLGPGDYCTVDFDAKSRWPETVPAGWSGGIQYTLWMVRKVQGQWYTSGGIEFWNGRGVDACGPVTDYIPNWFYGPAWNPIYSAGPLQPGEQVGFFVAQGDERAKDDHSFAERSQVVVLTWKGGSGVSGP